MRRAIAMICALSAALPLLILIAVVECTKFEFDNPYDPDGTNYIGDPVVTNFVDGRDGKSYKKVAIGSQVWMAENLNYDVPNVSSDECYSNSAANCSKYGRLYNWNTALTVCPSGWHLPSDAEWTVLTNYVGSNAGTKLKSTSGWNSGGNGTDNYGFSALPGGYSGGGFDHVGSYGNWWSATQYDASGAWNRYMGYGNEDVYRYDNVKTNLFSVRCVQD